MLVDGSMQVIERDTVVKWEVELEHVDPQELQRMGEEAVRNMVEKIWESVVWGLEQEVSLDDLMIGKMSMLGLRQGNIWLMKSMSETVGQA